MTYPRLNFAVWIACLVSATTLSAQQSSVAAKIQPTGEIETIQADFGFTEGPAWNPDGELFFSDIPKTTIHRLGGDGKISAVTTDSKHTNGMLMAADGRLLACQMDGQVVVRDLESGSTKILADEYEGQRFNAPNDLIIDKQGGIYFTDPLFRAPEPLPQKIQAVYYIHPATDGSATGKVSRVSEAIAAPNGIALSPAGTKLYVAPTGQAEMLVFDVKNPGELDNGRTFCRLTQPEGRNSTGGDGMTVDVEGNLYFTTNLGVEIFSPSGEQLGLVRFPQQPANVTFGGADRKTMYVTARTGLYRVSMPIAGLPAN